MGAVGVKLTVITFFLSMNHVMWELISNGLRDLTPHP